MAADNYLVNISHVTDGINAGQPSDYLLNRRPEREAEYPNMVINMTWAVRSRRKPIWWCEAQWEGCFMEEGESTE